MRKYVFLLFVAAVAGSGLFAEAPAGVAAASKDAAVFASKCAGCHGPDGRGAIAAAPNFTSAEWQASRSDADLAASIKNGKGQLMPAWGAKLSDAQISGLVRHVRSLKK